MAAADLIPTMDSTPTMNNSSKLLPNTSLSSHDNNILSLLFSSGEPSEPTTTTSPTSQSITIDPTLPPDPRIPTDILAGLRKREVEAILLAEKAVAGGEGAEYGGLDKALEVLNELVKEWPEYASAYVNRAQVRRLHVLHGTSEKFKERQPEGSGGGGWIHPILEAKEAKEIESDLITALGIASPSSSASGVTRISQNSYTLRKKIHEHLGTLYLSFAHGLRAVPVDGAGAGVADWEEKASRQFTLAGRLYGSEIGKRMGVWTNPWAKACGEMVREVMRREVEGESREMEKDG